MTAPRSGWSTTERLLWVASIGAAVAWSVFGLTGAQHGAAVAIKGAGVGALALVAFGRRDCLPGGGLFAAALAAHAAGDVLIEWRLLAGVGGFLAGHLGYLRLFYRERRPVAEIGGGAKLLLGAVALAASWFLARLAPHLGPIERVAIPLYVGALLAMGGSAVICRRGQPLLGAGAILFVASDALLSLELFGGRASAAGALVWPLYAAAQLSMARAWLGGGMSEARVPEAGAA